MDLSAFFGVVSTVEFALLGLWWITVQARADLRRRERKGLGMAYLVSLQFVVPGTASLVAQVAPHQAAVWRAAFAVAGGSGLAAILILVPALAETGAASVARMLSWSAAPLYAVITVTAIAPGLLQAISAQLTALQVEAVAFCLMILLSTQTAWAAAMTPDGEDAAGVGGSAESARPVA